MAGARSCYIPISFSAFALGDIERIVWNLVTWPTRLLSLVSKASDILFLSHMCKQQQSLAHEKEGEGVRKRVVFARKTW